MTRLVYPKPQPDPPWTARRWVLWAVLMVAWVVVTVYLAGWGTVVMLTVMIAFINWLEWRLQTVVTGEEITVKGRLRKWTLPVASLVEVQARNLTGDPVYAVTQAGRRRQLVKVKPEHLSEISALTGLPMRDYTGKA